MDMAYGCEERQEKERKGQLLFSSLFGIVKVWRVNVRCFRGALPPVDFRAVCY